MRIKGIQCESQQKEFCLIKKALYFLEKQVYRNRVKELEKEEKKIPLLINPYLNSSTKKNSCLHF